MITSLKTTLFILVLLQIGCTRNKPTDLLDFNSFKRYFEHFNEKDNELYPQHIPNDAAIAFLKENIPLIEVPDKDIEETYYFRWWTYRKHIKHTDDGFVITEFLPKVPWSKKHNTINCPAAHHIYEGRWLKNTQYISDYINFWLNHSEDGIRQYSFWIADALLAFHSVHQNKPVLRRQLPQLVDNYRAWERLRKDTTRELFWQYDNYDGMEITVSGRLLSESEKTFSHSAIRPTINSYMYGDAKAIAAIASWTGHPGIQSKFKQKAHVIKKEVQERLWNEGLDFFTVLPRDYNQTTQPVDVRELIGYLPWYFNLPDDTATYAKAWNKLTDTTGFYAPYGLTVCEQSHPYFSINYTGHECQWNGPSWPFATTQTLKSLSNFLNNYTNKGNVSKKDYYNLLLQYAKSHSITNEQGEKQKWIDENLNPFTGDWISRTRLKTWENGTWSAEKGGVERGKDYNHSGFCDLVISDLLGLKPRKDQTIEIHPLIPDDWEWFCLDKVAYHGHTLTIIWDKTGEKYKRGNGLMLFVDGKLKANVDQVSRLIFSME